MTDARAAILRGTAAAAALHQQLNSREHFESSGRSIDVIAAFEDRHVPVMMRPLDGLLGAYMRDPSPGVLINTRRPVSVQRFTAAHELGHVCLDHQPSLDGDDILRHSPFHPDRSEDAQEIEADAFASAFLLPLWLFTGLKQRHNWTNSAFANPEVVYQLSLRTGASYQATCYALKQHKIIPDVVCRRLLIEEPRNIKKALLHHYTPPNWYSDVWQLTCFDSGITIDGSRGDILTIQLCEHSAAGYLWDVSGLMASESFDIVDDRRHAVERGIGGATTRTLTVVAKHASSGKVKLAERRPWIPNSEHLTVLSFHYQFVDGSLSGLAPAIRQNHLRVA